MKGRVRPRPLGIGLVLALAIASSLLAAALSRAGSGHVVAAKAAPMPQGSADIGFGKAVDDSTIVSLVDRHSVTPQAVFMWVAGLSGTYRSYEPVAPAAFMQDARTNAVSNFEQGLQGNMLRLRDFIGRYSAGQLEANSSLVTQARSLLNIRVLLQKALDAAGSGAPLAFAVEVKGNPAELGSAAHDSAVKSSQISGQPTGPAAPSGSSSSLNTLKPAALQREVVDGTIANMDAQEVYAAMTQIVENGG
jgi:hypothetical protein